MYACKNAASWVAFVLQPGSAFTFSLMGFKRSAVILLEDSGQTTLGMALAEASPPLEAFIIGVLA